MATPRYAWQVTSQAVDQTTYDRAGNVVVGSYIYFRTGDGNDGVTFIDNNHLPNIEHVKKTLRDSAKLVDDIGRLSEGMDNR